MQQKTRTTAEIEQRANIVRLRMRKALRAYCSDKSEIRKARLDRIIESLEREFSHLEEEHREARKEAFEAKRIIKALAVIQPVRLN